MNDNRLAKSNKPDVAQSMMLCLVTRREKRPNWIQRLREKLHHAFLDKNYTSGYIGHDEVLNQWILPLQNYDIIETENEAILRIPNCRGALHKADETQDQYVPVLTFDDLQTSLNDSQHYIKAALSVTDDPRVEWACDWSDLGCFRQVHKFGNVVHPTVTLDKSTGAWELELYIPLTESQPTGHTLDLTIPDKVRWD
jgi:hypothetical protein